MLLELILRCFSQRSNLIRNLKQVNLFASTDEVLIFTYFTNLIVKLRDCIQSSDNFLTIVPDATSSALIKEFRQLIANLTIGLMKGSRVSENQKMMFDTSNNLSLSIDRQNMMNNLSIHQIVISFIQKKFPMVERIVESELPYDYRKEVLVLFQDCYTFLIFFCKANPNNQSVLYSKLEETLGNIKYEVGQIDLVCTVNEISSKVYEGNEQILGDLKNKLNILSIFTKLVEEEGRQVNFLKFFQTILSSREESLIVVVINFRITCTSS
jgi:hypothetical protein